MSLSGSFLPESWVFDLIFKMETNKSRLGDIIPIKIHIIYQCLGLKVLSPKVLSGTTIWKTGLNMNGASTCTSISVSICDNRFTPK